MLWIGTSWKMTKTIGEARAYVERLVEAEAAGRLPAGVQPFVLPPLTALAAVRDAVPRTSRLRIGAQNAHWAPEGAGTGEVSMRMVRDAGADIVEIGHSERRDDFGDSDDAVRRKVVAADASGLTPLVCVGEPAPVRDAGRAAEHVTAQLADALRDLPPERHDGVLVAYEPVWAIGEHGRAATPAEVAPVLRALADGPARRCRAVLYGGSVSPANVAELVTDPVLDGVFVGRAAWDVEGYLDLVERSVTALAAASAAV